MYSNMQKKMKGHKKIKSTKIRDSVIINPVCKIIIANIISTCNVEGLSAAHSSGDFGMNPACC